MLATNVAETSLTVPGIRYVIDPGIARISPLLGPHQGAAAADRADLARPRPTSAPAAADASPRASAIRLYSEEDFLGRPEFTEPEILRTNLASVILQMTSLGLGDLARFPFVEPPDKRNVSAGNQLLEELGAFAAPEPQAHEHRAEGAAPARSEGAPGQPPLPLVPRSRGASPIHGRRRPLRAPLRPAGVGAAQPREVAPAHGSPGSAAGWRAFRSTRGWPG